MQFNWLFYSDTNAQADLLEEALQKRDQALKRVVYLERLFDYLKTESNAAVIIRAHTVYNAYQLCSELSVKYPQLYIVLIIPDNMENARKAMQAGASNTLRFSHDKDEVRDIIIHAEKYMNHRKQLEEITEMDPSLLDQKVISICSTKGGAGRTSFTVNLALALSGEGQRVAVLDGDVQFGDAAMYLDLRPRKTIYEWIKEGENRTELDIDSFMTKHDSGVSVMPAPSRPEFFEMVTADDIQLVIQEMKKIYQIILIDNSAAISEVQLQCLNESDEILLLTDGTLPCVRNTKLYADTLDSMELKEKVRLIHNRSRKKDGMDPKKIEELTGLNIYVSLPDQQQLVERSIEEGRPYVMDNPKKPLSKQVQGMARKLLTGSDEVHKKNSKKLFSKAK
ncbi:AAA family ATPase [Alkalicoccus halolimnae]|uniref:AAA family ATPase n=1 Tax=Alkalicoccus halolimnae TaxID=1667239 RepID=A0A5C7FIY8_9BACI|nr:AAA family ATPase [Alkalicoccus halolimnae]TXF86099.1 AAA family ATPase [Alkalicoccus halolimnae]